MSVYLVNILQICSMHFVICSVAKNIVTALHFFRFRSEIPHTFFTGNNHYSVQNDAWWRVLVYCTYGKMLKLLLLSSVVRSAMFSTFCMLLLLSGYNFYGQMTGKKDFFAFPSVNRVLFCRAGIFVLLRQTSIAASIKLSGGYTSNFLFTAFCVLCLRNENPDSHNSHS